MEMVRGKLWLKGCCANGGWGGGPGDGFWAGTGVTHAGTAFPQGRAAFREPSDTARIRDEKSLG